MEFSHVSLNHHPHPFASQANVVPRESVDAFAGAGALRERVSLVVMNLPTRSLTSPL